MNERFEGFVLSVDIENERFFVESDTNSTAIIFRYKDIETLADMDLDAFKYRVAIDFNGIMTMSLPGQATADHVSVLETVPLDTLSGTVSRYANEGFYLTLADGSSIRVQSTDFVELGDVVTITYDATAALKSRRLTKTEL